MSRNTAEMTPTETTLTVLYRQWYAEIRIEMDGSSKYCCISDRDQGRDEPLRLTELLGIRPGITAVIGSGGKTTLLQTAGALLAEQGNRVLLCTTTKIFPFRDMPCAENLREMDCLRQTHRLLCSGKSVPGTGKYTALDVPVSALAERFDYVLVEADGAAQHPMKAHAPYEPVLPEPCDRILCVVGASGFWRPIREAAHRPVLYAERAGAALEDRITPEMAARVLRREPLHFHQIFVNQAETPQQKAAARQLAARMDCPVSAGSLQRGDWFLC